MQRRLLEAGSVDMPMGRLTGVTLAATAIANSMPAGPVVSSVFAFRQYRRSGADEGLAAWTLGAVFVAAAVSLALAASVGVAVAGAEGANSDLVAVTSGVLVVALVIGGVFMQRRALAWVIRSSVRASERLIGWPQGERLARINAIVVRVTSVRLRPGLAISARDHGGWPTG